MSNPLYLEPGRGLGARAPAPVPPGARPPVFAASESLLPGEPGMQTSMDCHYTRVGLAGGALQSLMVDKTIVPWEQLYRRLPEDSMFDPALSPDRPFSFEMGSFRVPDNETLILTDLRPDIYRFSGLDAGDYVPVEARRFSASLGFQIVVDNVPQGQVQFELDPLAIAATQSQFINVPAPGTPVAPSSFQEAVLRLNGAQAPPPRSVFNAAQSNSFAGAAGSGQSLMPQRPQRYGALSLPFCLVATGGQSVLVRCVVFRPLGSPIAFIEYDVAGIKMPQPWYTEMMKCAKPLFDPPR